MKTRTTLLAVALLPLASCQLERELNPTIEPGSLYSSVEQPADLPVPRELKLRSAANQSRYFGRGRFRTGNLVYEGALAIDELRGFLRSRLPDHGWELRSEERPVNERLVQHWVREHDHAVRYLLLAELEAAGGSSVLVYDLRTQRLPAESVESSGSKKRTDTAPTEPTRDDQER